MSISAPTTRGFTPGWSSPTAPAEALGRDRLVAGWLLACCALVFAMVVLGGVTRLTGSGLSMVRWEPVSGVVPPSSAAQWEREFAHYRESPEYRRVNRGMSLEAFKRIFWFEYAHRLLGRLIGVAFLLPLVWFAVRGRVGGRLRTRLGIVFVLGAAQGLLGWYMVKSGLVRDPHVSPYRLTAHLALAVLIYAVLLWTALDLLRPAGMRGRRLLLPGLAALTIVSGGFVAGLKAGHAYNTFPLMAGQWIPQGMYAASPWYLNLFENVTTVQFNHRVLALLTFAAVVAAWVGSRRSPPPARGWAHAALAAAAVQVGLGISTLLLAVPVALGAAHQAGALALLTVLLCRAHAR